MKLRTGLTPDAWTPNVPAAARPHGYVASVSGRGFVVAGERVVGRSGATVDETSTERVRAYRARKRAAKEMRA